MRRVSCVFVILTALITSHVWGEENLFPCQKDNGFIMWDCHLKEKSLLSSPGFESQYSLKYSFPCLGHSTSVGIKSGTSFDKLRQGAKNEQLNILSREELSLFDPGSASTRQLSFKPGCHLIMHELSYKPSQGTLTQWLESQKKLKAQLVIYEESVIALNDSLLFHEACLLFETLGDFLLVELSAATRYELVENIKHVMPILKAIMRGNVSQQEKAALLNIQLLILQAGDASSYFDDHGKPKKLIDFLSEEEKLVMEELKTRLDLPQTQREEKKKELQDLISLTKEKISSLESLISFWSPSG